MQKSELQIVSDLVLIGGGHSGETSQMSCGLSVNGFADPAELMLKAGVRPGDMLILTKSARQRCPVCG
ncbi:MAG: hypothetical protein GY896_20605 [Gammaproteobacteria bacterium]|nr:hypothetical protein [Gammaproteobacteria bacterium]